MPPTEIICKNVDVNVVQFTDDDGDKITFEIAPGGKALTYAVGGQKRPPFKKLEWSPRVGTPGVSMPDIAKGFPLPMKNLDTILGGLRCLAKKAGIACDIEQKCVISEVDLDGVPGASRGLGLGGGGMGMGGGGMGGGGMGGMGMGGIGGGYGGGFTPGKDYGAAPGAKPAAKLSQKKIYQKKLSELTTQYKDLDVPEVEPPQGIIKFLDDDEEEVEVFQKGQGKMGYRKGSEKEQEFKSVAYEHRMGLPALHLTDTGKWLVLQAGEEAMVQRVIGGIRWFAKQSGNAEFDCQIPDKIKVPPEVDYALPKEQADALGSVAAER